MYTTVNHFNFYYFNLEVNIEKKSSNLVIKLNVKKTFEKNESKFFLKKMFKCHYINDVI